MNGDQIAAREAIIKLLLALPWPEREDVFSSVRHNGIFCTACGYGSPERPNTDCQCCNDT